MNIYWLSLMQQFALAPHFTPSFLKGLYYLCVIFSRNIFYYALLKVLFLMYLAHRTVGYYHTIFLIFCHFRFTYPVYFSICHFKKVSILLHFQRLFSHGYFVKVTPKKGKNSSTTHIGLLRTGISIKYPEVQFWFDSVRQKKMIVWMK